jgi:hypothetical protein
MAVKGTLVGLTSAELGQVRAAALSCILANNVRGVNYSIAGRSFGFPSIADAQQLLLEANFAAARLSGTTSMNVRANFNPSIGRGSGFQ